MTSLRADAHKTKHKSKKRKRHHHGQQQLQLHHSHHGHPEHFADDKLVKYYKYLYEQKCKESDHYKKLYRAKNKECEQLTMLNQQYQGRVITYLLENHTNNPASSCASSISRCSSPSDIRIRDGSSTMGMGDDDYRAGHDVDPINVMHDADSVHWDTYSATNSAEVAATASVGNITTTNTTALNSVSGYDFVVDVSYNIYLIKLLMCRLWLRLSVIR